MREGLEQLLASGKDNALLRFGLGNACMGDGDLELAREHLSKAVEMNPRYTAAWKLLGRVLVNLEQFKQAQEVLEKGVEIAQEQGDKQAEKEMQVFLKRAVKAQDTAAK